MKNPWVIVGIITVVLFGSAIWYSGKSAERSNEGVEIKQHITGNPESSIKLVEYSDFQCPACKSFQPLVKDVLSQYGGDISFEYKNFPLLSIHPNALLAAIAAEAAGQQGKFFEFGDLLFDRQEEWSSMPAPRVKFVEYAEEISLDVEKFKLHLGSSMLRDKVLSEFDEGRELGVSGTPTFFLNGEKMQLNTVEEFKEQIAATVSPSSTSSINSNPAPTEVNFGF